MTQFPPYIITWNDFADFYKFIVFIPPPQCELWKAVASVAFTEVPSVPACLREEATWLFAAEGSPAQALGPCPHQKAASHYRQSGLAGVELPKAQASALSPPLCPPSPRTSQALTLMAPVAIWMWCSRRRVLSLSMK